jgi:hypothetical protein
MVQCQVPFYVATELAKLRQSATVPTPGAYVVLSVRWLGHGGMVSPVSAPRRGIVCDDRTRSEAGAR